VAGAIPYPAFGFPEVYMKTFFSILAVIFLATPFGVAKAQGNPPTTRSIVFAQTAVGCEGEGGCSNLSVSQWRTCVWAATAAQSFNNIDCSIYDKDGNPWSVTISNPDGSNARPGDGFGFGFSPNIGASFVFSSLSILATGYVKCTQPMVWDSQSQTYVPGMAINLAYLRLDGNNNVLTSVGVDPVVPGTSFLTQAIITPSTDIGLAIINVGTADTMLTFNLWKAQSPSSPVATATKILKPGHQVALFVSQLDWSPALLPDSRGSLFSDGTLSVNSDGQPIGFAALRYDENPTGGVYTNSNVYPKKQ
jgi:hypothetical protein